MTYLSDIERGRRNLTLGKLSYGLTSHRQAPSVDHLERHDPTVVVPESGDGFV